MAQKCARSGQFLLGRGGASSRSASTQSIRLRGKCNRAKKVNESNARSKDRWSFRLMPRLSCTAPSMRLMLHFCALAPHPTPASSGGGSRTACHSSPRNCRSQTLHSKIGRLASPWNRRSHSSGRLARHPLLPNALCGTRPWPHPLTCSPRCG
jgi:hypothetical protein